MENQLFSYMAGLSLYGTQRLAQNVTGIKVPLSGHWFPEEQSKFVINQLSKKPTIQILWKIVPGS